MVRIAPYRARSAPGRFRIEGERLQLRPKAVLALSLAFHELATNAVKYGALSNDSGSCFDRLAGRAAIAAV